MYIEIKDDTFSIVERLKALDKNYIIKYNTEQKRFEVWFKENDFKEHLEIVLPYPCLDYRTIYKVANSNSKKIDKIIYEINKNNEAIKEKAKNDLMDELSFKVKTIVS